MTKFIGESFKRAYKFFKAAKILRDDLEYIYDKSTDEFKLLEEIELIKNEILKDKNGNGQMGKIRHLFGSALSPKGLIDYYNTIIENKHKIYYINSKSVNKSSYFMEKIVGEAIGKSYDVEVYHEPLDEKRIETIIIPKLNIAMTSHIKYKENHFKKIDIMIYMDKKILKDEDGKIKEDNELIGSLLNKGIKCIEKAKEKHDRLEEFYVSNVDFKKIDMLKDIIIKDILKYKGK
ncbi:MAG: hypothetical protein N4A57_03680 [Anaeromicrobium sp.]|jgi:hypothetical protein|uniref:hypothetical protein n=1 Tax=Anaeromicrobium sp. TaxID=1929132 RepID=UPI0025D292C3|nr:hypothetical protein [Anaeromicrobium sp.]MCT4593359.1 hypothetical protein [Anaeromicrobium sp.]